jgi:hypothetical protein
MCGHSWTTESKEMHKFTKQQFQLASQFCCVQNLKAILCSKSQSHFAVFKI